MYGVGVNDFNDIVVTPNGTLYEYTIWNDMLRRCHSKKLHLKFPTYSLCEVDDYFLSFTNFYNFVRSMVGFNKRDKNGKLFQMDKDILVKGNKLYSRETICFVPHEINCFVVKSNAARGKNVIGVGYHKAAKKFTAQLNVGKKLKHLGCFNSEIEAFHAYKDAKEEQAKILAEQWKDEIDPRVYKVLMNYQVEITD